MEQSELILITSHVVEGERFETVHDWPERARISLGALVNADRSMMRLDGGNILITPYNGMASYRIVGYETWLASFDCELIMGSLTPESEFTFPKQEVPA